MANLLFATVCCLVPAIIFAIGILVGAAQRVGEHGAYRFKEPMDDYIYEEVPWYTTRYKHPGQRLTDYPLPKDEQQ